MRVTDGPSTAATAQSGPEGEANEAKLIDGLPWMDEVGKTDRRRGRRYEEKKFSFRLQMNVHLTI